MTSIDNRLIRYPESSDSIAPEIQSWRRRKRRQIDGRRDPLI